MTDSSKSYGEGRIRSNVSYADVERAAIIILKAERRPTVETIREALGGGSPDTIGNALRRFWRDLGARIEGDPAALTRMPTEIAELADGMWQRALKLAGESASYDDNAARARLRQLEIENDIKQQSLAMREREIDTQARERERALADARDHLLALSKALAREQGTNQAHARQITDLETEVGQYRQQIATLIAGVIAAKQTTRNTRRKIHNPAAQQRKSQRVKRTSRRVTSTPVKRPTPSRQASSRPSRTGARKTSGRKRR